VLTNLIIRTETHYFRHAYHPTRDSIKMHLTEIGWGGVDLIYLVQDRDCVGASLQWFVLHTVLGVAVVSSD
jgi:hypothetical protein